VTLGPRARLEAQPVTQQQLREPVTRAHQIDADVLARPDEVTQRLLLGARHPDTVQLARQQQPGQVLGIAAIGLDSVARRARDLPRRADQTVHAAALHLAREAVASRAGLIGRAHRARQARAEPRRLAHDTGQPERAHLAGLDVEHRRHDLDGVHVETDHGLSLRHGRLLLCGCGHPRGWPPARTTPHDRVGSRPYLPTGPDINRHRV
jgi:hypothetical protein